jgi:ketosteroid isomerase-like protein
MRRYLALVLLVAAVAFPLPARPSASEDPEALVEKYLDAFNSPDPVALAGLYAKNGLVLPPTGGPVLGREAIKKFWTNSGRRGLTLDILRKDVCGDAGFFVGRYEAREASHGEFLPANRSLAQAGIRRPAERGNFVLCVKRGDRGAWQIAADMWNDSAQVGFIPAAQPDPIKPAPQQSR